MSRIALDHLVGWLEASVGDLGDGELLVVSLLGGDDWSVGDEREVDSGVWDQVGLELGKIDVEGTIESEGSGDGGASRRRIPSRMSRSLVQGTERAERGVRGT